MADQRNRKRPCVLIVQPDLEQGIKLADWLAAHGYQAVLLRSAATAIMECRHLRPQVVFIGLHPADPTTSTNLRPLFLAIGASSPGIAVITMGYRSSNNPIHVTTNGGVRHVLVHSIEFPQLALLLQEELTRSTVPRTSSETGSQYVDDRPIDNFSQRRAVQEEASTWIA